MSPLPSGAVLHPGWARHHRAASQGWHTATCEIRGKSTAWTWDPATESRVPVAGTLHYSGPCSMQPMTGTLATPQGGATVENRVYTVTVPADVVGITPGMSVEILTAPGDPGAVGRRLTIDDVAAASETFVRALTCTYAAG